MSIHGLGLAILCTLSFKLNLKQVPCALGYVFEKKKFV